MRDCSERDRMMDQWYEAVENLSAAVRKLKTCQGDEMKFAGQYRLTEAARLHAENIRLTLDLHRNQHEC